MSDPLPVTECVAGLIQVTSRISKLAYRLYISGKVAPRSMFRISEEMNQMNVVFSQVQRIIEGHGRRQNGRGLTMSSLHDLMTILTGCALSYSNLDKKLCKVAGLAVENDKGKNPVLQDKSLNTAMRVKWALWNELEAEEILKDIQRHNLSLNMIMLTVIQSNTSISDDTNYIEEQVNKISDSIAKFKFPSLTSQKRYDEPTNGSDFENDCASIRTTATTMSYRSMLSIQISSFTEELKKSSAYKRVSKRVSNYWDSQSVFSKDSCDSMGPGWSMLSDLTLGNSLSISEIGVWELPVTVSQLYDPECANDTLPLRQTRYHWFRKQKAIAAQPSDPEESQFGLTQLYIPRPEESAEVDIIAIHGLGGHFRNTWSRKKKNKNVCWLEDFLPHREKLKTARVWTFGYGANLIGSSLVSEISDIAISFLKALDAKLGPSSPNYRKRRPVIIICHSLGGIIVKKAMKLAKDGAKTLVHYEKLYESIHGIVFMGTPHRGSKSADIASVAVMAAKICLPGYTNSQLINGLKRESNLLNDISEEFKICIPDFKIASCYEDNIRMGFIRKPIVTKISASLRLEGEEEDLIPIPKGHLGMVRFSSIKDPGYSRVCSTIERMVESSLQLQLLRNQQMERVREKLGNCNFSQEKKNVLNPWVVGTCSWLLQDPVIKQWLQEDSPKNLWLHGDEGSGKSVLSGYLVAELLRVACQAQYKQQAASIAAFGLPETIPVVLPHRGPPVVVYYFFNGQKPPTTECTNAIGSLLLQLLTINDCLYSLVDSRSRELESNGIKLYEDLTELFETFKICLQKSCNMKTIFIIIDGIDSIDEYSEIEQESSHRTRGQDKTRQGPQFLQCLFTLQDELSQWIATNSILFKIFIASRCNMISSPRSDIFLSLNQVLLKNTVQFPLPEAQLKANVRQFAKQKVSEFAEIDWEGLCHDGNRRQVLLLRQRLEDAVVAHGGSSIMSASIAWAHFKRLVGTWSRDQIQERIQDLEKLSSGDFNKGRPQAPFPRKYIRPQDAPADSLFTASSPAPTVCPVKALFDVELQAGGYITPQQADVPCRLLNKQVLTNALTALVGINSKLVQLHSSWINNDIAHFLSSGFDFGMAYAAARVGWRAIDHVSPEHEVSLQRVRWVEELKKLRAKRVAAIYKDETGQEVIRSPYSIMPLRVWDLKSNRVVDYPLLQSEALSRMAESTDRTDSNPEAIMFNFHPYTFWAVSHSWTNDMQGVYTPINQYQWPVPLPKGVILEDTIRGELQHLGAEYVWLDVVCLRQRLQTPNSEFENTDLEEIRRIEWKIDVPTIGNIYRVAGRVVRYFNGLGVPFSTQGWDNDRHWLKRAWTLQEIKTENTTFNGAVSKVNSPVLLNTWSELQLSKTRVTLRQVLAPVLSLAAKVDTPDGCGVYELAREMAGRYSSQPIDKVTGLLYVLRTVELPTYDANFSEETAWQKCFHVLPPARKIEILFDFPYPGAMGDGQWFPTWKQIMEWPERDPNYDHTPASRTEQDTNPNPPALVHESRMSFLIRDIWGIRNVTIQDTSNFNEYLVRVENPERTFGFYGPYKNQKPVDIISGRPITLVTPDFNPSINWIVCEEHGIHEEPEERPAFRGKTNECLVLKKIGVLRTDSCSEISLLGMNSSNRSLQQIDALFV